MNGLRYFVVAALLMFASCMPQGMDEVLPGLLMKKIHSDKSVELLADSAVLELRLRIHDAGGAALQCNPEFAFEKGFDSLVLKGNKHDLLHALMKQLRVGDSAVFEIEKSQHLKRKFGGKNGPYKGSVRILRQWPLSNDEQTLLAMEEQSIARRVSGDKTWKALANGLFIQWDEGGLRDSGSLSENVCLRYKGGFLNGQIIDNHSKNCFEFIAAGEKQLIPGLDWFVRRANPGSRATLIIPYSLAYGALGSSTGIVPPYKTLIFDAFILPTSHDHQKTNSKSNP